MSDPYREGSEESRGTTYRVEPNGRGGYRVVRRRLARDGEGREYHEEEEIGTYPTAAEAEARAEQERFYSAADAEEGNPEAVEEYQRRIQEAQERDRDGDGFDDETGEEVGYVGDPAAAGRERVRREREAAGADDAGQQAERMDAGGDRYAGMGRDPYGGRQGGDYSGSGGGATGGLGGGGGGGEGGGVSDFDQASADIPVWGWLSGATARRDASEADREAMRAEGYWHLLGLDEPTADELAVDYEAAADRHATGRSQLGDTYADEQDIEAQRDALRAMQDVYRSGGMTEADRARSRMAQDEVGRWMRSQREADDAALQARGMGGSGASIASMLSAQQGGASALAQRDAEMLQDAQAREMQAMQAAGGLASGMREQGFSEGATRGSAVDDFNRWSAESRSGATNQTRESLSQARQGVYENRERRVAGLTGQWQAASSGQRQDQARQDEADQRGAQVIGDIIEEIL